MRQNLRSLVYTPSTLLVGPLVKVQVSLPYYRRILSMKAVMRLILSLFEKLDVQIDFSL